MIFKRLGEEALKDDEGMGECRDEHSHHKDGLFCLLLFYFYFLYNNPVISNMS